MPDTSAPAIAAAPPDVATMFATLQRQLEDTRQQLFELANRKDPKDITLREVVTSYLAAWPDEVTAQERKDRTKCLLAFARFCGDKRISEAGAVDLMSFLRSHPSWAAGCKLGRKVSQIKRAFNWALAERLIREFPFKGVKIRKSKHGRPITPAEYRALVRHTPAHFRRLLLFLLHTGCRPSEACGLRFEQINWQRCTALLELHKTAKKTGEPRELVLQPVLMQLLRWLRDHRPRPSTAHWLAELLGARGSLTLAELNREARKEGITHRMLWKAKRSIGADLIRGDGRKQPARYVLRRPPRLSCEDDASDFVFLNAKGKPWSKTSLDSTMARLRRRRVLRKGAKLYGLRHKMATDLIRAGTNPRVVASVMGHKKLETTMGYTHTVNQDLRLMQRELQKVNRNTPVIEASRRSEETN